MNKTLQLTHEVRISECDMFARWRPASMLLETQEMAEIHAASYHLGRLDMLPHDMCWVIYRQSARVHAYPTFHEKVNITTWPGKLEGPIFPRHFIMERPDGTPLCEMVSAWILMGVSTRRPLRPSTLPMPIPLNDREAPLPMPAMLRIEGAELIGERGVCYSDLDVNGHMNNTRYIDWVCDALGAETMRKSGLTDWQINYISEALPGETLRLFAKEREGGMLVLGRRQSDDKVVFEASIGFSK